MRSIQQMVQTEYEIQKSRFYSFLYPVFSLDEVHEYLTNLQKKYPDATHYCYAYIINHVKHCSDDGEPSKTAGMPILNVLEKQKINFVLCVVVRYFGGILLGTGGLVRAYTTCVTKVLGMANFVDLVQGKEMLLTFSYGQKQLVDRLLQNSKILEMQYQDTITYRVLIADTDWDIIASQVNWKNIVIVKPCFVMLP